MKLFEIDNEPFYEAEIKFVSRGNSRKGSWSTKQVRARLQSHGFHVEGFFPDKPDNQELQVVKFSGTREEIIAARTEISRMLRIISNGAMIYNFKLTNS